MNAKFERMEYLMNTLHISKEEALDIMAADKMIDSGEELFELEGEAARISKEARGSGSCRPHKKTRKTKAPNKEKAEIIEQISFLLEELNFITEVDVIHTEREIKFICEDGKRMKLTLMVERDKE